MHQGNITSVPGSWAARGARRRVSPLRRVDTLDAVIRLNAALQGRYRIEREIGEGGMATVYLAADLKHNRNVALKVCSTGGERARD